MDRDVLREKIADLAIRHLVPTASGTYGQMIARNDAVSVEKFTDAILALVEPLVGVVEAVKDQATRHGRACSSIAPHEGTCYHHLTPFVLAALAQERG